MGKEWRQNIKICLMLFLEIFLSARVLDGENILEFKKSVLSILYFVTQNSFLLNYF